MTNWTSDDSLETIAADVRKVGEEALRTIKGADTPPEEVGTLRTCGTGLIEESYEVAIVLSTGSPGPSAKANTLAAWYLQWRAEQPPTDSPYPPRTPAP